MRSFHVRRRHRLLFPSGVVVLPTVVALSGCAGPLSIVEPAGPAADAIATLWWVMLAGATAIFSFVTALLVLAFRRGNTTGDEKSQERTWIVGLGLGFPSVVLLALLAYGLYVGERLLPRENADLVRVEAEARRWEWRFGYGELTAAPTLNVLHIPAGRPVDVAITTVDVIHSFWVPRLAGKLDAIPGHVNVLRLEADQPGTYYGRSGEFSGVGYDHHGFTVIAHDAAGWQAFLESGR